MLTGRGEARHRVSAASYAAVAAGFSSWLPAGQATPSLFLRPCCRITMSWHECNIRPRLIPRAVPFHRPRPKRVSALLECRSGQPFEELRKRPVRLKLKRARPTAKLPPSYVYSLHRT